MTVPPTIRTAMQQAVLEGVFPGAVLAVRVGGRLRYTASVGRLSYEPDDHLVQPSTVYDLASLTKPLVTVTAMALFVQNAMLRLEDPIQDLLGELRGYPIGQATIRDLLTHSSGLPGWRPLYERLNAMGVSPDHANQPSSREAVLRVIREEPLIYEKGTRSLYSDLGFIILGLIVEGVSGLSLDRWFEQTVAIPLQAHPLGYCPTKTAIDSCVLDRSQIAPTEFDSWRNRLLQGEVHDENAAALGGIAGHAGLFGNAEAVLCVSGAWLRAYQSETSILTTAVARRFIIRDLRVPESSWALGWDTPSAPSSSGHYFSPESFGHLGYTGTSLWIDPTRQLEVVLLSNRVHPSHLNQKIRDFRPQIHDLVVQEYVENG